MITSFAFKRKKSFVKYDHKNCHLPTLLLHPVHKQGSCMCALKMQGCPGRLPVWVFFINKFTFWQQNYLFLGRPFQPIWAAFTPFAHIPPCLHACTCTYVKLKTLLGLALMLLNISVHLMLMVKPFVEP